jgi:coenzyme Q-binding protein COQ10
MPQAETEILIEAPLEHVFDVIADYERYPEFLPEMKSVRVESRRDGICVARFDVEIVMRISYTLRLREERPHGVTWSLSEAGMLELNEGGWRLASTPEGHTHARYGVELKLRGLIPKSVSTRLVGESLPQMLRRFKARAEGAPRGA